MKRYIGFIVWVGLSACVYLWFAEGKEWARNVVTFLTILLVPLAVLILLSASAVTRETERERVKSILEARLARFDKWPRRAAFIASICLFVVSGHLWYAFAWAFFLITDFMQQTAVEKVQKRFP